MTGKAPGGEGVQRIGAILVGERLVEPHPYDVPESIALSVSAGHASYLPGVDAEVDSGRRWRTPP